MACFQRIVFQTARIVFLGMIFGGLEAADRPHIVYFLADDLGWSDVGWHGSEIKTPNLDKLAMEGARLEQFYVLPVCSPTRAALLTGRYPIRHGLQLSVVRPWAQYGLPLEERTLPQALKEAGYNTAINGKWHLGHFRPEYLPMQRGFDSQYGHYNGMVDYFTHERDGGHDWHRNDRDSRDEGYSTTLIGDEAVRVVEQQDPTTPLFLYIPFNAPHSPLQVTEAYLKEYATIGDKKRQAYAAMVHCLDEQVGRVVAAFEKRGMGSNTLFLFSSDNGGPLEQGATNGPFRAGKTTLYEGGTRVVACANWQGRIKPGTIVNEPMHIVDWYPTLLKLVGVSTDQKLALDGLDIWPTITQSKPSPHDSILINSVPESGAVRMGNWKLVWNGSIGANDLQSAIKKAPFKETAKNKKKSIQDSSVGHVELFNLADDPYEKTNLASQNPSKVLELRTELEKYAREAVPPKAEEPQSDFKSPKVWGEVTQLHAAEESKPNVIIMLVDDMGVMDTSLPFLTDDRGNPKRYPLNDYYRTPNMEKLAARGIRFNQFCAMSVCSPTRIAIMTGQNAARHRTTNWINPDNDNAGPNGPPDWNWTGLKKGDVTLASLLQANGYRTIHVGKGHFGPRASEGADPKNLGFDINVGGASIGAPASYYGTKNYGNEGGSVKTTSKAAVAGLDKYLGTETFLTEALTIEANRHISDAVKEKRPFFLYFPQYAVHAPFNSDPRFAANYKDSGKPAPAQAFATLIEGMDKSLGDILGQLDTLGVADNTLIFFVGDNGSDAPLGHQHAVACAAPLRGKKGSHYEGGTRVPFIAAWAKTNATNPHQMRLPIAVSAIQSQQAAVYDMFPTILSLASIQTPAQHAVDGKRLDTLLTGKRDTARDETFLMHYPHAPHRTEYFTVYRDGEWKVIYHYFPSDVSEGSHYQLFHLKSDPFEQTNLTSSKPEELQRMMNGLINALDKQQAVYPVDNDRQILKPLLPSN